MLKFLTLGKNCYNPMKFSTTPCKYSEYLSPHIVNILKNLQNQDKHLKKYTCEEYFNKIMASPEFSENKNIIEIRSKFNMIFNSVFQLQNFQKQRGVVCQFIIENKINDQAQLDGLLKMILKEVRFNNQIGRQQFDKFLSSKNQNACQFIQKLKNDFAKIKDEPLNNICKKYRQKYPNLPNKLIYDQIAKIKKKICQTFSSKQHIQNQVQDNKFWDKIKNIKPRLLKEEINDPLIYQQHLKITQGKQRFRFPPQPNGYLHIGHVKSIRINFQTAKRVNGMCFLRYDDTNPDKETHEFIKEIQQNVKWMGYNPDKITFTSDYFQQMIFLANQLIKKGYAYICQSSQNQIQLQRKQKRPNPYRQRPIQQSLKIYPNLLENQTLRLKLDYAASNPTLRDPIIFRKKITPHPRTHTKFNIYPMYDFAHCISDSIEHIDYSLCSLQFQIRRQLYYTILHILGMYKPIVWEFSRLNIDGNILSKRKIKELVDQKLIQGWDDPRLLTIRGMQNRGFTPTILKNFIDKVNASRASNQKVVRYNVLQKEMKKEIACITAPNQAKLMGIVNPILIEVNCSLKKIEQKSIQMNNFSKYQRLIGQNTKVYLEKQEFNKLKENDILILKYIGPFKVCKKQSLQNEEIQKSNVLMIERLSQTVEEIKKQSKKSTQNISILSWIGEKNALKTQATFFLPLLTQKQQFNPNSKYQKSILIQSEIMTKKSEYWHLQRIGYFKFHQGSKLICCAQL